MNQMTKDFYRVVASAQTRDPYPVYKYFEDPEEWIGRGTVVVSCKDGKVDVKIMETDSNRIHTLSVWSDEGPVAARLTEQCEHPA